MRFSKVCGSVFVAGLLIVVTAPGWADSITYLSDERSVSASVRACVDDLCEEEIRDSAADAPAPGASVFDSAVAVGAAGASHNSTLASTSMSGSGSVSAYANPWAMESSSAESLFLVRFRLDDASAFDLAASLEWGVGAFEWILDLRVADGDSICFYELAPAIHETGVLAAGDYELEIVGTAWGAEYGDGAWHFDFTVVPEAHTALLLGLGLAAVALCRRSS
jgi:hypothetical protein